MSEFINDFTAGTLASCLVSIFYHPMDTIKVNQLFNLFVCFTLDKNAKQYRKIFECNEMLDFDL